MILQRYIFREVLVSFALTITTILCVMIVGAAFQFVREYSNPGVEFFLKVAPTLLIYTAPYAIIISAATSATLSYGRLAADNEIDAMRTSGYPVARVLLPALWIGIGLAAVSYGINAYLAPQAHYNRRILLHQSVLALLKDPPPGPKTIRIGQNILSYQDARKSRLIRPVVIRMKDQGVMFERYRAADGEIHIEAGRPLEFRLRQVRYERLDPANPQRGEWESFTYELDIEDLYRRPKRPADLPGQDLMKYIRDPDTESRVVPRAWTEYFDRISRSLAVLLLTILGACMGIITRKGSRLAGLGAALPVVVGYMVFWALGKGMGERGRLDPALATFGPDGIVAIVLIVLLWRILRK